MRWPWRRTVDAHAEPVDPKIRRAELRLADAEHELRLWGRHFGTSPSERARYESAVEAAREKLERLRAEVPRLDEQEQP